MFGIVLPKAESGADVTFIAAPHRQRPDPRHRHRNRAEPVRAAELSRHQGAAGGDELGRRGPVRRARRDFEIRPDGELAFTYKLARSLTLAGAVAAGVQPVDGVFADFKDDAGLEREARAAASEGFTGKLAIHPGQVAIINAAFTPSAAEVAHAEAIIAAFGADPEAGVLSVGGRMVDRPHLLQAQGVLARAR
jgi:citrate lyase subunit beta/citryl-CoA lyase